MKENKYDDEAFFEKYSAFPRSVGGLTAAGEWHEFRKLLPDFAGKRVLDMGCGFGWHCIYAAEQGAKTVLGTDISEKMLEKAREMTDCPNVVYKRAAIEDLSFDAESFDAVISSLALHYVESFAAVCSSVYDWLAPEGTFAFSVEHPVFTAYGTQDWFYGDDGATLHWPVDRYFSEGWRDAVFLGEQVAKHHKTLTTYLQSLIDAGFSLEAIVEPEPTDEMLDAVPEMKDELRRPMMLLVRAAKRA